MAVYKVPQDVEAEDKLLGPFSFRQFIYLIVSLLGTVVAWVLGSIFIPLGILPLPIIILFGALALPLKKDQPMEIYLAAVLSFYLKPRRRLWEADGVQSLIEIVAPRVVEEQRTKELSQSEAEQRLSYLANIVDSRGWAVRGVGIPEAENAMQSDVYFEAQHTQDVLDDGGTTANNFDNMIDQAEAQRRREALERMRQPPVQSGPVAIPIADPYASLAQPSSQSTSTPPSAEDATISDVKLVYNPYPAAMHQNVINPLGTAPAQPPQRVQQPPVQQIPQPPQTQAIPQQPTSKPIVSPDIISLANNSDLSIETIAHEAKRIHEKEERSSGEEVVISLR